MKFEPILLKDVRIVHPALLAPKKYKNIGEEYYSVMGLIPKTAPDVKATIQKIKHMAQAVCGGNVPSDFKLGIADGDAKNPITGDFIKSGEHYRGHYYFNSKTKFKPEVVVGIEKADFYDLDIPHQGSGWGCWLRATPYSYDVGNRGISLGLGSLWLRTPGEPILGQSGLSAFDDAEDDDNTGVTSVADIKQGSFGSSSSGSQAADELEDLLGM